MTLLRSSGASQGTALPASATRDLWRRLARDILAVPEEVLARREAPVAVDLAMECQRAGYCTGDLFIQVLQAARERPDLDHRWSKARAPFRAALLADAKAPEPVVDMAALRAAASGAQRLDRTRVPADARRAGEHPRIKALRSE
jgi:hypothetical protein